MTPLHDKLQAFVDGELAPDEAAAFRDHLATCERCERGLLDAMQLAALGAELGAAQAAPPGRRVAPVADLAARRRRVIVVVAPLLAAAAAFAVWMGTRPDAHERSAPVASLTLAEQRSFEPRLSSAQVDRWRAYDVQRSGGEAPREDIPLKTLAALEDTKDFRTLVGAYVLMHDDRQAEAALARAGDNADTLSDRAALALAQKKAEVALAFADAALASAPQHAQALWNRALALRDLGLPLSAAAAFDAVAARGEPGWSDEARARAARLRADGKTAAESWQQAERAGKLLVSTGATLTDEQIAAHPGLARLYLYHALRSAPSRARVAALAPLAMQLDRRFGGSALADSVARVAAADFAARAPLAATYLAHFSGARRLDDAGARRFVAELDRAPARAEVADIRVGILLLTSLGAERPADLERTAKALHDPWYDVMPARSAALHLRDQGDFKGAERALRAAIASSREPYRTMQLEFDLVEVMTFYFYRPLEVRRQLLPALAIARSLGEWKPEGQFLLFLGQAAAMLGEHDLARAYLDEERRRVLFVDDERYRCYELTFVHTVLVTSEIARLRFDTALAQLRAQPRCAPPSDPQDILVVADLARFGLSEREVTQANQDLESLTAHYGDQAGLAVAKDYLRGRLLAARDPAAAAPILAQAIVHADAAPADRLLASQMRAYAYLTSMTLAAAKGDFAGALDLFAAEVHLPAPTRCALGVAFDDDQIIVAARGADGAPTGSLGRRTRPSVDAATVVPAAVVDALRACPEVEVIARAPLHGQVLLPPEMAWSFAGANTAPSPRSAGLAERRLVVANPEPPADLGLPPLGQWAGDDAPGTIRLVGAAATPSRVLSELRSATDVEIHAHGWVNTASADTSMLVLSPDGDGKFALSAQDLAGVQLEGHPLVILAACETTETAPYLHETWNLPAAFVAAGASAVLASSAPIPDAQAAEFFAQVRARLRSGRSVAQSVRDVRSEWLAKDPHSWVGRVLVFESISRESTR